MRKYLLAPTPVSQWVSEWVSDSFRLVIAIASPSFGSLLSSVIAEHRAKSIMGGEEMTGIGEMTGLSKLLRPLLKYPHTGACKALHVHCIVLNSCVQH